MKQILLIICGTFLFANDTIAQDGNDLFGTDQVIKVELTFSQASFWDSLVANYATETVMKADVVITDNTGSYTIPNIGIRLKGNSSYSHPGNKKSFKIDFNEYISGQKYNGLKKLNFNNCFKDPSFMREKLFFDVCKDAGISGPRVNYANVYMNGIFWGFYNVVDQIDKTFLGWNSTDDTGNLFKAGDNFGGTNLAADLKYYGALQSNYDGRYELKTNETANDWSDLLVLIDYINNSTSTDFENNFSSNFNTSKLLRSIALDNLFSNLDSYLNSARNYYIYHNTLTNKWEWIKWDANEAFGSYNGGPGAGNLEQLAPNYVAADRPLITKIFASPTLYAAYQTEMCYLLNNYFNSIYINPKADAIKTLIQADVYADGNKQYTNTQFDSNIESNISITGGGPGGSQTVYGIKSFVTNRATYMNGQIDCSTASLEELITNQALIYPNPATNFITIQLNETIESLSLYNLQGQKIVEQPTINDKKYLLDISTLNAGIYLIQIKESAQTFTQRIEKY